MALLPLLLALAGGRDWERSRHSVREERITRAERRELVRSSLRSTAAHGYYIFDELMTDEAGMIDFLAVGPVGACVIVVRDEGGIVTADVDGTLYLDGRRFEDDPKLQADELGDDVDAKLESSEVKTRNVICFTRAELYYLGENPDEVLRGVCPTWDLALAFAEAMEEYSPADVAELAEEVERIYRRPPFVRPAGTGS